MDHVGRAQQITALGQQWTIGRWDRAVWAEMFDFARGILPNPVTEAFAALDRLPLIADPGKDAPEAEKKAYATRSTRQEHAAEFLVRSALDKASSYLSVGSPEMQSLLGSIEGASHLLWLLLRKAHSDVTQDQAYEILMEVGQQKAEELFGKAAGKAPGPGGNAEAPAAK